jgi:hypothetical protein
MVVLMETLYSPWLLRLDEVLPVSKGDMHEPSMRSFKKTLKNIQEASEALKARRIVPNNEASHHAAGLDEARKHLRDKLKMMSAEAAVQYL